MSCSRLNSSTLMTKCSFCSATDEAAEISQQKKKPSCTTIKVIKAEVLSLHWGNLQLRKPPGIGEPTSSTPGTPTWEENSINKVTYEEITCSCFLFWDTNVQNLCFQNTHLGTKNVEESKSLSEQELSSFRKMWISEVLNEYQWHDL